MVSYLIGSAFVLLVAALLDAVLHLVRALRRRLVHSWAHSVGHEQRTLGSRV